MKIKYCKLCGGALDYDKQCTECGKQYFRFNKSAFAILLLSIALTCSVSFGFIKIYKLQHEIGVDEILISRKKDKISSLEGEIEDLNKQIETLESDKKNLSYKAKVLDTYVAFVVGNGKKYHTADCQHFKNCETFYVYSITGAEAQGYEPCKVCHK